jgi:diaminopimelate decarboxylase
VTAHAAQGSSTGAGRAQGAPRVTDPTTYTPQYAWRSGQLHCEGVDLERIAGKVHTPAYVYSGGAITDAYRSMDRALHGVPHTICYSLKANSNISILRLLARLGSGFDIVSGGELYSLQRAGVPTDRVVFYGVGKSREEIRDGLRAGIRLFNVESEAELDVLAAEASRLGRRAPAAIRVNPDVMAGGHPHIATGHHHHKFGMDWSDAWRLYLVHRRSRWIEWQGISAHIGSQILTLTPYRSALARLANCVMELARAGVSFRYLDIGGGLGVRYTNERPMTRAAWGRALAATVRPLRCHLLLEPGRSIVAPAGVLLTRVLYTKRNRGKTFVVVDAAMNDLLRPALYCAVHSVTAAKRPSRSAKTPARADVVGPVCESGDCFVRDWPLGDVAAGDLLVLWGTGAYGFTLASNYNRRPRPAEVLVEGKRFRVIRRRESHADMVRGE